MALAKITVLKSVFYPCLRNVKVFYMNFNAEKFRNDVQTTDFSCSTCTRNGTINSEWISSWCLLIELGFTACKAEQPLRGMELQEKEAQKG